MSPLGILNRERLLKAASDIEALAGDVHNAGQDFEASLSCFLRAAAYEKTRDGSDRLANRYRFKVRANELLKRANQEIRENQEELGRANRRLEELSRLDPLTGLANRRELLERLGTKKTRAEETGRPFSLIMGDVDCFKEYNDFLGHDCGDHLLKSLAPLLRRSIRRQDLVCRWGGDEFLFLLPETDLRGGKAALKNIDNLVRRSVFRCGGKSLRMRISLGLSVCRRGKNIDDCIKEADLAMFRQKRRNKSSLKALLLRAAHRDA